MMEVLLTEIWKNGSVNGQKHHFSHHLICFYMLKNGGFWIKMEVAAIKIIRRSKLIVSLNVRCF
jgi:hypothetical protein